jgi:hypothetical protein
MDKGFIESLLMHIHSSRNRVGSAYWAFWSRWSCSSKMSIAQLPHDHADLLCNVQGLSAPL